MARLTDAQALAGIVLVVYGSLIAFIAVLVMFDVLPVWGWR